MLIFFYQRFLFSKKKIVNENLDMFLKNEKKLFGDTKFSKLINYSIDMCGASSHVLHILCNKKQKKKILSTFFFLIIKKIIPLFHFLYVLNFFQKWLILGCLITTLLFLQEFLKESNINIWICL
jgi:hypothetical protein